MCIYVRILGRRGEQVRLPFRGTLEGVREGRVHPKLKLKKKIVELKTTVQKWVFPLLKTVFQFLYLYLRVYTVLLSPKHFMKRP